MQQITRDGFHPSIILPSLTEVTFYIVIICKLYKFFFYESLYFFQVFKKAIVISSSPISSKRFKHPNLPK
ncbi:hypothetical protein CW304_06885 [Bacillus sp. UFRGS-B20]|nr:hypothetical protein CW304_06885 [Bacillus sp. UFRGS-B20]